MPFEVGFGGAVALACDGESFAGPGRIAGKEPLQNTAPGQERAVRDLPGVGA
jgi:hypothetical protein